MPIMPIHPSRARVERDVVPSKILPFLIFAVSMFLVWQVNRHNHLKRIVEAHIEESKRDMQTQFVNSTGSRRELVEGKTASGIHANSTGLAAMPPPPPPRAFQFADVCHTEAHAEYHGDVVKWGENNLMETAGDCCRACKQAERCNVWVWCGTPSGCGSGTPRPYKECWLKSAPLQHLLDWSVGKGHAGIAWTSGVLFTDREYSDYTRAKAERESKEAERIKALHDDETLPLVWLDVALKGVKLGRMEIVLFAKESPLAAENMRRLCAGDVPGSTLKGSKFYRIIDQFIDQTGPDGPPALGGTFRDDPGGLQLKHDRKGLLSAANGGPNTNTGHFSIMVGPAAHLNGHYTIFGEVVSGHQIIDKINQLSKGKPNNELLGSNDAIIVDVGQIRRGKPVSPKAIREGLAIDRRQLALNKRKQAAGAAGAAHAA